MPVTVIAPPTSVAETLPVRIVKLAAAVGVMFWVTLTTVPPVTPIKPPVALLPLVTLPEVKDCVTVTAPAAAVVAPTDIAAPTSLLALSEAAVTVTALPPLTVIVPASAPVRFVTLISVVAAPVTSVANAPAVVPTNLVGVPNAAAVKSRV